MGTSAESLGGRAEPSGTRAVAGPAAASRSAGASTSAAGVESAREPMLRFDGSRVRRHRPGVRAALGALPLVAPALALLGVAVGWPLVDLVRASIGHYGALWHEPALAAVALRTGIWVVGVVPVTLVLSLSIAQLFAVRFHFRRAARTALILPLAASVTVTAVVFRWALDPRAGLINVVLHALGLVSLNSNDASWLTRPGWAFAWMMAVAVFVSVPLTTYVLLAGLRTIPQALRDAARLDGPAAWRRLWSVTLPQLRPALAAAALIDLITVFNALPIVWEMTRGGPGERTDITTSFMFGLRGTSPGESAALSVADLVLVALAVVAFLAVTRPQALGRSRAVAGPAGSGAGRTGAGARTRAEPPLERRRLSRGRAAAVSVAACGVALIFLVPYLEMIVGALRPPGQMFADNVLPTHFTLRNFSAVWNAGIGHNLLRSAEIAGGATAIVMLCAIAAALHGARQRAGHRTPVLVLAVTAQLLGPVVLLDGLARVSVRVGASSTVSLIVIDAAFNLGFAIWFLERSFRSVPGGLGDAAALDHLTPAGRLLRVSLSPGAGAVLTAVLVTFVSAWDELAVALALTGTGTGARRPLTVAINDQLGQASLQWGHVLAVCVIAALPAIVLVGLIEGRLTKAAG